jgi:hypothetical protein
MSHEGPSRMASDEVMPKSHRTDTFSGLSWKFG